MVCFGQFGSVIICFDHFGICLGLFLFISLVCFNQSGLFSFVFISFDQFLLLLVIFCKFWLFYVLVINQKTILALIKNKFFEQKKNNFFLLFHLPFFFFFFLYFNLFFAVVFLFTLFRNYLNYTILSAIEFARIKEHYTLFAILFF